MNIILITVLLSIAGTCLVGYFILLSIMSYMMMKFKTKAEGSFKHLERWIDDNQNTVFKELEIRDLENQKKFDDLKNLLDSKIVEVYRTINFNENENQRKIDVLNNKVEQEVYRTIDTHVSNLNSKIDSRCDKLQEKIDSLKKDVDLHYTLLGTQRI